MKKIILVLLAQLALSQIAGADANLMISGHPVNDYVRAIYRAEGGQKATWAYGIRSIPYSSIAEARRICHNSVVNSSLRWRKAGSPGGFLEFMSRRYCPVGAKNDPNGLNKNWVRNVKYFLTNKTN